VYQVPDDSGDTIRRAALAVRRGAIKAAQETACLLASIQFMEVWKIFTSMGD